jgi:hypothetical protein
MAVNVVETWIQNAAWFWNACVAGFGRDPVCEDAYGIATLVALVAVAWLALFLARKNFLAWREMRINEQRILARKEVAPAHVMRRFKWPGDSAGAPTVSYQDLVSKIREEQEKRRQDGSG